MAKKPAAYKVPKTLGACADALYTTRQDRLVMQKDVSEHEVREKMLKEHIINTLPKSESTGVAGKLARVSVTSKVIPVVTDWEALYKYILKTKSFDLLERRLNGQAVHERWEAGKEIPGVGTFNAVGVSVNKL